MAGNKLTDEEKKAREAARRQYESIREADLTGYAEIIGENLGSKINILSKLIGGAHEPSVGSYKERFLANGIRDFIPQKYGVGTGFVLFPKRKDASSVSPMSSIFNALTSEVSNQLDIIIYDQTNYPLIFRDGDFIIVRPEAVRSIIEVKGFLNINKSDEFMDLFVNFGKKWRDCDMYYQSRGYESQLRRPGLFLMCWDVAVDTEGRRLGDGKKLRERVAEKYQALDKSMLKEHNFPVLTKAFIYNDCSVESTIYQKDNEDSFGYNTRQGKFVIPDGKGNPALGKDRTIASLVAAIHYTLDAPFNPLLSYLDKTSRDPLPHAAAGYSEWLTGDEVKLITEWRGQQ